jgi:hypothetical protein
MQNLCDKPNQKVQKFEIGKILQKLLNHKMPIMTRLHDNTAKSLFKRSAVCQDGTDGPAALL